MSGALWVFAYGSLIWSPGFTSAETRRARLDGYARRFCVRSISYRGTPEHPGLVLGLLPVAGARCEGMALRVRRGAKAVVLEMLRARELARPAYREARVLLTLEGGVSVEAVTYVVNPDVQYYCALTPEEQARVIAGASGLKGPNSEYLWQTEAALTQAGVSDPDLAALSERVRGIVTSAAEGLRQ